MNITFLSKVEYAALNITYGVMDNRLDTAQPLMVASCAQGVVAIRPFKNDVSEVVELHWVRDDAKNSALCQEVEAYLGGKAMQWQTPVVMAGSPFRAKIWQEIANIPFGETITYSELAERAGNPKAIRAAASGCATNPVPLIVPCHRVVGKGGGLGGFAWGLPYKKSLLALEQNNSWSARRNG